jgi:hypothetical protein
LKTGPEVVQDTEAINCFEGMNWAPGEGENYKKEGRNTTTTRKLISYATG